MDFSYRLYGAREQGQLKNEWMRIRFDTLLPALMAQTGIDMWIVSSQENNEDPVMRTLLPAPMLYSGRRTILVFFRNADGVVERYSISRPGFALDLMYKSVWLNNKGGNWSAFSAISPDKNVQGADIGEPETQMDCLNRIVRQCNPQKIGLNYSSDESYGDGISHGTFLLFQNSLEQPYADRIVPAADLCIAWLETRIPQELDAYKGIVKLTVQLMRDGFSGQAVHPGVTTAADLEWWLMDRAVSLGLQPWFHFMVAIRRKGAAGLSGDAVILEGDLLHVDIGIQYMGLATDLQENAYILRVGETTPPAGLVKLFAQGQRLQDILAAEMREGRTGNQVLADALSVAKAEGLRPMIYSHPIGIYGHSAGPSVGLVDNQEFLEISGERVLRDNTMYAMELNVVGAVEEWDNQSIMMGMETDVLLHDNKLQFIHRQAELYVIE